MRFFMSTQTQKPQRTYRRLGFLVFVLFVLVLGNTLASEDQDLAKDSPAEECENPAADLNKARMITKEELATKTSVDGDEIWISILGEVYNVTDGAKHYAKGKSYGNFAGRDASVPFVTGRFTADEADKSPMVLNSTDLPGLAEWRDFYRTHAVYKFVGKLIDPRYYDATGEPTDEMMKLQEQIQTARAEQALRLKKKKEERLKKQKEKEIEEASKPKAKAKSKFSGK